jgi:hypothetical protein
MDDPHDAYTFFVVYNDRIVRERMSLFDSHDSGFNPSIFAYDDRHDVWENDTAWRDASDRFWYRRFYQETRTGQLMVLRSDAPELYHLPEGRWTARELLDELTTLRNDFSTSWPLLVIWLGSPVLAISWISRADNWIVSSIKVGISLLVGVAFYGGIKFLRYRRRFQ